MKINSTFLCLCIILSIACNKYGSSLPLNKKRNQFLLALSKNEFICDSALSVNFLSASDIFPISVGFRVKDSLVYFPSQFKSPHSLMKKGYYYLPFFRVLPWDSSQLEHLGFIRQEGKDIIFLDTIDDIYSSDVCESRGIPQMLFSFHKLKYLRKHKLDFPLQYIPPDSVADKFVYEVRGLKRYMQDALVYSTGEYYYDKVLKDKIYRLDVTVSHIARGDFDACNSFNGEHFTKIYFSPKHGILYLELLLKNKEGKPCKCINKDLPSVTKKRIQEDK